MEYKNTALVENSVGGAIRLNPCSNGIQKYEQKTKLFIHIHLS